MNAAHNCLLLAAALGAGLPAESPAVDPTRYSFTDIYRLTVRGAAPASAGFAGGSAEAVRLAAAPALAGEPAFSVAPESEPRPWLLLVSGLTLAGWLAHRRLVQPL